MSLNIIANTDILDIAKQFSEFITNEEKTAKSDMKSMIVLYQWIAMEYVLMRHSIFLNWLLEKHEKISYSMVRNDIVVVSRIMGYDQEDIYEYLEKSFKNLIWEWGYMAMLLGKTS